MRIIYPSDDGGVCVIIPAPECGLTIEEIAAKDVPPFIIVRGSDGGIASSTPRPYKIVADSDIPSDRTFRGAWTWAS